MGLVATQSAETTQVDPLTTTAEHRYYSTFGGDDSLHA